MSVTTPAPHVIARFSLPTGRQVSPAAPEHAVVLLRPPYERLEPVVGWSPSRSRETLPGSVLGIRINRPVQDLARLEQSVQTIRRESPSTPVVLLLDLPVEDGLYLSAQAARMGVRAAVCSGDSVKETLRRSLTQGTGLAAEVVDWLGMRGLRLSPLVASLVMQIVALAPYHVNLTALLEAVGIPETSARFRMNKKRLPPPSRWFQAARALHAALRIQAEPESGLLRIAHRLGYADHSALSQLVYRSFRVRPGAIRGTLGWEWLLERWIDVQGIRLVGVTGPVVVAR